MAIWEQNQLWNIDRPYLPDTTVSVISWVEFTSSASQRSLGCWSSLQPPLAGRFAEHFALCPQGSCWNKGGISNLRQLSICLPWPEQVFPSCSDKNIGRLQRGRNEGTERYYDTAYRLQEICSGAKNRTEVLGFCTSTTRPFLSSSHLVSPMISLQQWLAKEALHCANQLLSGAGWRPNTSPQMFSQPLKI